MVVDDDPQVLTHTELTRALGNQANNPRRSRRFWDILQNFPRFTDFRRKTHLNGIELCQVVRNDPLWSELPVLFLTAHAEVD